MSVEIVIYALVAAGLIFWLRSVLGTRHGDERQRPNPFVRDSAEQNSQTANTVKNLNTPVGANGVTEGVSLPDLMAIAMALPKSGGAAIANAAVEENLKDIIRQDKAFTLSHFLTGAQDAFAMIVEAYAAGDRDLLKTLLSPSLYAAFESAISDREESGHTMLTEIQAIRKTEVIDAVIKDRNIYITVRFVADERSAVKDKDGNVIEGHAERTSETIDIWTFGRSLRAKDPTWFLYATREEEAGATTMPEKSL